MKLWKLAAGYLVLRAVMSSSSSKFRCLPVPAAAFFAAVERRRASGQQGAGSPYGDRVDPLNPEQRRHHAGTDVAVPTGTPLLAVDDGVVSSVERGTSAGNIIRYMTTHGRVSCMHLSRIDVAVGDRVAAGQVIGATGATGNVTGPHLHLELRPLTATSAVDPLPYFPV